MCDVVCVCARCITVVLYLALSPQQQNEIHTTQTQLWRALSPFSSLILCNHTFYLVPPFVQSQPLLPSTDVHSHAKITPSPLLLLRFTVCTRVVSLPSLFRTHSLYASGEPHELVFVAPHLVEVFRGDPLRKAIQQRVGGNLQVCGW